MCSIWVGPRNSVHDDNAERVAVMRALMAAFEAECAELAVRIGGAEDVLLDESTVRELEALGYVR